MKVRIVNLIWAVVVSSIGIIGMIIHPTDLRYCLITMLGIILLWMVSLAQGVESNIIEKIEQLALRSRQRSRDGEG